MENHMYHILQKLLLKNNIRLHEAELKLQLLSHPSYPSLHALTGVLDHFNVDNLAVKLPANKEVLEQLPRHFIANVQVENADQLALVDKKGTNIKLHLDNKETKTVTSDEFLSLWDGITVAIEKDDTIQTVKNNPLSSVATWGLIVIGGILAGFFLFSANSTFPIAHFILSALGVVLSVFIVQHELGMQSSAANQFCNLSEHTSCDAILNAKGATLFGLFKLSDVSIVSFVGYICCWFALAFTGTNAISEMGLLTVLAVPVTLYSIYYQGVIVKKWCPLCLGIVGVLWLQLAGLFTQSETLTNPAFSIKTIIIISLVFITTAIVWNFIKPLIKKKETLADLEVEHYKFKRNFSLFHALYTEGTPLTHTDEILGEIVLGNSKAPVTLTLITSPLCYYCKSAHKEVESLLKKAQGKLNVRLRFMTDPSQKESTLYKTISELLHIYHTSGQKATVDVLDQLYAADADVAQWIKQQNVHYNPGYDKVMAEQTSWCKDNAINFTPALYLNDKPYPNEYDRMDLLFFIDDLIESQKLPETIMENERIAS